MTSVKDTRVEARPGMKVGFDGLQGVVPAKIVRLYYDRDGLEMLELECLGPTCSWHGQNPGGYKEGLRMDVESRHVAPWKNFKVRGHQIWWMPVRWRSPMSEERGEDEYDHHHCP